MTYILTALATLLISISIISAHEQIVPGVYADGHSINAAPAVQAFMCVATIGQLASDPDGDAITVQWAKASGPGDVLFTNPNDIITDLCVSESGIYTLDVSVSDGTLTVVDDVVVTVP